MSRVELTCFTGAACSLSLSIQSLVRLLLGSVEARQKVVVAAEYLGALPLLPVTADDSRINKLTNIQTVGAKTM